MNLLNRFYSFRLRIASMLIFSLVATVVVLYRLNQLAEIRIIAEVEQQRLQLTNAINVAQRSLTSTKYLRDFLEKERYLEKNRSQSQAKHEENYVKRILVTDSVGNIVDSSDEMDIKQHYNTLQYGTFKEAIDFDNRPNNRSYKVYTFPLATVSEADMTKIDEQKTSYIIIIFSDDMGKELRESSLNRLIATGGVLLLAVMLSLWLILQFTRPVGVLVQAAQQVAKGNFGIDLPVARRDELGQLMAVFNEMVRGLKEREALEARLYRAEQSAIVGRLASGIAHEVKNPLNYISLTVDYLRGKYAPPEEQAKAKFVDKMDSIKDEIKRLDRLIRNFLTYGRPLDLTLKPVALPDLINGIVSLTKESTDQQGIQVLVDNEANIPVIEADVERLRSCFSNLIMNAQQAMPGEGQIQIQFVSKMVNKDNGVEVSIADTGNGIAPENLEKIFEPYFSTKDTGTGLGLALVKRIIEGHGGTITVSSTLDVGTTFCVWLPARPPKEALFPTMEKVAHLPGI
jgi:signal transduction histidine kinase